MERDFMGLNSKEEAIETALLKSSAIQWSLSNGHEGLNNHHSTENKDSPRGPVQLTIFYKGMVNVYNDMSPEKAQAIMFLAGNGTMAQTQAQAHVTTPRTPADGLQMTPTSVGPSTGTSSATPTDTLKKMSSFRLMQSAVPQMRGASLARFLEKRRERVMASAPYSKGSMESSNKPESSNGPSKDDTK
ncbi:ZIM-domain protein 3 [Artemisia annua]|uniref:Protein TIFY n=1 Tax=Artemisia annua TaxID=35608 RepID=A0A2U1NAQ1_ARTAN|nr:ZIM-domain protein 3 [Artemisia annua]